MGEINFIIKNILVVFILGAFVGFAFGTFYKDIAPIRGRFSVVNAALYVIMCILNGLTPESSAYCLFISVLSAVAVIDFKTYEIPISLNIFVLLLGIIMTALDYKNILSHIAGFLGISIILLFIYFLSKGKLGGGDVKLIAASGLLLGFDKIVIGIFAGCILAIVFLLFRIMLKGQKKIFAFGPFLALGFMLSAIFL